MSLNTGLAQKLAAAIAVAHPDQYETWFYFPGPALGWDPYRAFINDTLKPALPLELQEGVHNWHRWGRRGERVREGRDVERQKSGREHSEE